jgi:hypothetical protein
MLRPVGQMAINIEQARRAKAKVLENQAVLAWAQGIGIRRIHEDYCVQVNLEDALPALIFDQFPRNVDVGDSVVEVVYDIVGTVTAKPAIVQ